MKSIVSLFLLLAIALKLHADEPQITWEPPPTIVTTNDTGLRVTNWLSRANYAGSQFTNPMPTNWMYCLAITDTNTNLRLYDLNTTETTSPVLSMSFLARNLTSITNATALFQSLTNGSYLGWISIIENRGRESGWVYSDEWSSSAAFYWSNKTLFLPPRNFKFMTTNTIAGN